MLTCQYCNKEFSTKITLYQHQQKAKYCLLLQGSSNVDYQCEHCKNLLSTRERLITHYASCKIKRKIEEENKENTITNEYKTTIKDLQNEILFYKDKLKDRDDYILKLEARLDKFENVITNMASEPKTTTTNNTMTDNSVTITNRFDINDTTQIREVLQKYLTKDVIARGQEGIAVMLSEHLLKGPNGESLYECTDVARQKFEFINADGNIETDPKATKLIRSIGQSGLSVQAKVAADDLWTKPDGKMDADKYSVYAGKVTEVMQLDKDSTKLRNKLASVTVRQRRARK